jgi:hypothetical protein
MSERYTFDMASTIMKGATPTRMMDHHRQMTPAEVLERLNEQDREIKVFKKQADMVMELATLKAHEQDAEIKRLRNQVSGIIACETQYDTEEAVCIEVPIELWMTMKEEADDE